MANADTVTTTATMQAAVSDVFSMDFYTDAKVLYTTNIPFTNIDPTKSMCYADGRQEYDGKADTGVVCRSNLNTTWYLKMSATAVSSPPFPMANFKYYMGQPWNRTLNVSADGTLSNAPDWYPAPTSPVVMYTAGTNDKSNLPYGTLATLSFSVNPEGLTSGYTYTISINYTLTVTP
ncbi:MAG: hypothetical protein HZA30_04860 [Candidatus Omnitrophica bacterium]|nr:hypothetical protein [Candidatus Omnitrophota bacterium]